MIDGRERQQCLSAPARWGKNAERHTECKRNDEAVFPVLLTYMENPKEFAVTTIKQIY